MNLQQIIVLAIGIVLGGFVVFRIIRAFVRKEPDFCSGCMEKECPHRKDEKGTIIVVFKFYPTR